MGLRNKMVLSVVVAPVLVTSLLPTTSLLPQNKSHEVLAQTLNKKEVLNSKSTSGVSTEDVVNEDTKINKDSKDVVQSKKPLVKEVSTEQPTTEKPTTEKPTVDKSTTEKAKVDRPTVESPVIRENSSKNDKSTIEVQTTERPVKTEVKRPTVNRGVVKNKGDVGVSSQVGNKADDVFKGALIDKDGVKVTDLNKSRVKDSNKSDTKKDIIVDKNGLKSSRETIVKDREREEDVLAKTSGVIKAYKDKINSLKSNKEKLMSELDKLEEKIKTNKALMKKVMREQSVKSKELLELKKKHALTVDKKNEKLELFKKRVAILQQNKTSGFNVLEGSNSFTDVKVKLQQFKNLSENDKTIINELDKIINTLDAQEEEISKRVDDLREDEKKLRKLETSMLEVRTKQNIVLETLNKKQIDLEMSLSDREADVDGIKRNISDLTDSERDVVEVISEGKSIDMSNKYQEYLDSVKKKRGEVKERLVKDKKRIAELETKKDLTKSEESLAKTLRSSIKKGENYLSESKDRGFIAPTKGVITSVVAHRNLFGYNEYHSGIDIANALGTSIYATEDGVVTYAGPIDNGYGNVIVIDHYIDGKVYSSLYGHMSAIGVKKGDKVKRGELIALMGSEGRSTGSHLHFEMYDKKKTDWSFNNLINPFDYIPRSEF